MRPRWLWTRARVLALLATAISALALVSLPAGASTGAVARLSVSVFAHVPAPGYPANAVLDTDGDVYAGTFKPLEGGSTAPSKVFAFGPDGAILRTYTISGQTPGAAHGVQVAANDAAGRLYLLDQAPARVLILDPKTGQQTAYATIPTLSAGSAPEPDFAAWGPDGSLYITDYAQFVIWRVPPGGGTAKVWLSSPDFNGIIVGPAGIQLMPDHHTLMFDTGGGGANILSGKLYTVPIQADGSPGPLHQIWQSAAVEAPDGFAIAKSGNVYIALVGPLANAVVEVSPSGQTIARVPANPLANGGMPVPFDAPGSVLFDDDSILVGNQSSIAENAAHMALLKVDVGEPGQPIYVPPAPRKPAVRLHLTLTPSHLVANVHQRVLFTVTANGRPVSRATITVGLLTRRTDSHGHLTATLLFGTPGPRQVTASKRGDTSATAVMTVANPR